MLNVQEHSLCTRNTQQAHQTVTVVSVGLNQQALNLQRFETQKWKGNLGYGIVSPLNTLGFTLFCASQRST